jgi:DNA-binding HxlR family transcriptional regulator
VAVEDRRLRRMQELIGRKWDLMVLVHLSERPRRFMQLVNGIRAGEESISERVLSDTLKRLSETGMVRSTTIDGTRKVWTPTPRGRHIATTIQQLAHDDTTDP